MNNNDVNGHLKLLFNLQCKNVEEPWIEGYGEYESAFLNQNPYQDGSIDYFKWQEGWLDCFYKESSFNDKKFSEKESCKQIKDNNNNSIKYVINT